MAGDLRQRADTAGASARAAPYSIAERALAPLRRRLATPEPARRHLRRMKAGATALLGVALAAYLLSFLGPGGSQGVQFLRAASEAALVGGLADWFAVTALFRRPLRLPIPHTALIPTRKEALARSLGDFVTRFFLQQEVIRSHLARVDVVGGIATWLTDPDHAGVLARGAGTAAADLLEAAGPEPVVAAALSAVRADMGQRSYARQAGRLLQITVDSQAYVPVLDLLLAQGVQWLTGSEDVAVLLLREHITGFFRRLVVSENRLRESVVRPARQLLEAALAEPGHPLRGQVARFLSGVADKLRLDPVLGHRVDTAARKLVDDPEVRTWLLGQADGTLSALQGLLREPASGPVDRLTRALQDWGRRAGDDPAFRARLEAFLDRLVGRLDPYASEFATFIVETVKGWDARDTADRIEVAVGRDLQFIRLNGTVVGAAAGVLIHALSLLLT